MKDIPTAEELETLFREGKMECLGDGSRRVCYALPGGKLCVKSYRSEAELEMRMNADGSLGKYTLKPSIIREIRKARFDGRRNTSCQEYRYWRKLHEKLPPEVSEVFPQTMECVFVPSRGWCIVEERVGNFDGGRPLRFSHEFRSASPEYKERLLAALKKTVSDFICYAVRFYDPQNLVVQKTADGGFRLRLLDFEPATRSFIPVDSMLPSLVRMKTMRRVLRWMRGHLGIGKKNILLEKYRLSMKLRAKWDRLIATEGAAMGLSDCRVFLENKLVNDIFYKGLYKGKPCVVKCSSRAPESIANGADLLGRMFAVAPDVVPEVYGSYRTPDGDMAFVVTEYLSGPSLRGLLRGQDKIDHARADAFSADMRAIAAALRETGIVHRDINEDNLLIGDDGHLKLIDFQFAVDRAVYRETDFMRKNWKYLYVVFAFSAPLGGAAWNDMRALRIRAQLLPPTESVVSLVSDLERAEKDAVFSVPISRSVRFYLVFYFASLLLQRMVRTDTASRGVVDKRIGLVKTLLRKKNT